MKILLIDDSKTINKIYQLKLEAANFEVVSAEDGQDGLEKARTAKPDLILLDMMMPKMNGFEFLEQFKLDQTLQRIPVVIFSSLGQQNDINKAMALGAKKYLPKDEFTPKQIITEIKKILGK